MLLIPTLNTGMIPYTMLSIILLPLLGAAGVGLMRHQLGRAGAHTLTIVGVALSFFQTLMLLKWSLVGQQAAYQFTLYNWSVYPSLGLQVGFLIDPLSTLMMSVVTFVSLLVHIYSIGYMQDDEGYQRFFSYMSLFTFAMLMLVSANNFLQLFFGWEGVGLVSYLLIGFWFQRESAVAGSLKAFLVNRVGDFGFLLGMILLFGVTGTFGYEGAIQQATVLAKQQFVLWGHWQVSLITLINLLLFVGVMGKSAQLPLHIWLPESMEGPTPISALIHAATMVTAGVYMMTRLSPLYEQSPVALNVILCVGATGAFFLGLVAVVQTDIKRVIAYSTLSQLGYMVAATGASFAAAGMFHLMTHAFFKALLFLGAGSVIVALHHEQDIRKMGNLRRYMPITHGTFLAGVLSLSAFPPFSGFYSKDAIISAVGASKLPGAYYAYICLLLGAFVTALYSFRVFFLTFYGQENLEHPEAIKEPGYAITLPLVVLSVPSVIIGLWLAPTMLYAHPGFWKSSIFVASQHQSVINELGAEYLSWTHAIWEALRQLPFWFSAAGAAVAWLCYLACPGLSTGLVKRGYWIYYVLVHQYGFDALSQWLLVTPARYFGRLCDQKVDRQVIDHRLVDGTGRTMSRLSAYIRRLQSGYLYHYVFIMIIGLLVGLTGLMLTI